MAEERILIIDDEPNIRETMQLTLEASGYTVETAEDGIEGLNRFGDGERWDLVLLDQRMPRMEGYEVLQVLRARDPSSRVVMVTAYGSIELAVDAMKAGALDFLRKPFSPEVLRGAVSAALAHPRGPVDLDHADLVHVTPRRLASGLPMIHFRTLNGFKFWPVPLSASEQETDALRIRRGYEIQAPGGARQRCAVEVTTSIRSQVAEHTGREFPPDHEIWDTICRSFLGNHLLETAEMPSEKLLVFGLTRDQLHTVRAMSALGLSRV